jgi:signal transduction histidine kinase
MGGSITVRSEVGKGSTFSMSVALKNILERSFDGIYTEESE